MCASSRLSPRHAYRQAVQAHFHILVSALGLRSLLQLLCLIAECLEACRQLVLAPAIGRCVLALSQAEPAALTRELRPVVVADPLPHCGVELGLGDPGSLGQSRRCRDGPRCCHLSRLVLLLPLLVELLVLAPALSLAHLLSLFAILVWLAPASAWLTACALAAACLPLLLRQILPSCGQDAVCAGVF